MLVSVVVPVFNTEKYIRKCIESLIYQTFSNVEIIVIDDCSMDSSIRIVKEYANLDSRISIIRNPINKGLSYSRNVGIHNSKGDYLIFVDSDDYIEKDTIEDLVSFSKKGLNSDVIIFGNYNHIYNRTPEVILPNFKTETIIREDIKNVLFKDIIGTEDKYIGMPKVGFQPWHYFIDINFLRKNEIEFKSEREILFEDLQFAFDMFEKTNSVKILKKAYYHYVVRKNSLSNSQDDLKIELLDVLYDSLRKHVLLENEKNRTYFNNSISNYLFFFIQKVNNINSLKKIKNSKCFTELIEKKDLTSYPIKVRILFNLCIKKKYFLLLSIVKIKSLLNNI
ncbi:glycosyltransferase [Lactococcus lactis]|uniref:glycosyltransferase family 2 protein n=1 Tax=Lactococcus lactis TaxID=1358 RepID=UPI001F10083E|nr:glycosyltransferase family 2 protein [Lactococcus lactis]MCH5427900.1 glycosyltransferase [Lactococcus lactis]MCT0086436.1 glycosyltransferase family 2 protein [Lactococcus lactis subsp. lactis]